MQGPGAPPLALQLQVAAVQVLVGGVVRDPVVEHAGLHRAGARGPLPFPIPSNQVSNSD